LTGMFDSLKTHFRRWKSLGEFNKLPRKKRRLVFYSEGPANWPHLRDLVTSTLEQADFPACLVSSSASDPALQIEEGPGFQKFEIGDGWVRTLFFSSLDCDVLVMTMPDLGLSYIRRSPNPVHYVYVHHSLVSVHMVYSKGAFDHFDTIFCAGPHHESETRAVEKFYDLRPVNLVPHGYGRLDGIFREKNNPPPLPDKDTAVRVLIAPSWGPSGLLETIGKDLVPVLLNAGIEVCVRPHPQTALLTPSSIEELRRNFSEQPGFRLDENISGHESLQWAHLMISDWSGAALDFALGLKKPVLFADVPRKVNNPEYEKIGITPMEVTIRTEIGSVLPVAEIDSAPERIRELMNRTFDEERISSLRTRWVYNVGKSGSEGARSLLNLLEQHTTGSSARSASTSGHSE
jgi:hypothetical protein